MKAEPSDPEDDQESKPRAIVSSEVKSDSGCENGAKAGTERNEDTRTKTNTCIAGCKEENNSWDLDFC
jgi:hypothetical protein